MDLRLSLAAVLFLCSCVTYDFTPVEPLFLVSRTLNIDRHPILEKPDLFLLVDKSGSMNFGVDSPGCSCSAGGCPAGCPTRWTELRSAMGTFLTQQGTVAHLGMVPFPRDAVCGGAQTSDISSVGVDLNASPDTDLLAMQQTADAIRARIGQIVPEGGTPTGASIDSLLTYSPLINDTLRPRFALLLTDGLPNCNGANDPNTCTCTLPNNPAVCSVGPANQCLDDNGTVASIQRLKDAGVKTIVLGFGAETQVGLGPATLQALALAGGFNRPCTVDADCGAGDSCSVQTMACGNPTKACAQRFYQASNAAELGSALDAIRSSIDCGNPCRFDLGSEPIANPYLSVHVNGQALARDQPDTWRYDVAGNAIEILGSRCTDIHNATPRMPVKVEIGVVVTF